MKIQKIEDQATLCGSPPSVLAAFLKPTEDMLSTEDFSQLIVSRMFAAVDAARKNSN